MASDKAQARAQWLAQVKVARRNERRLERVFKAVYGATIDRWELAGAVTVPIEAQRDLAAALTRMWREAVAIGGAFPMADEKAAWGLDVKQELTLFERIMLEFISRFGALKVQQILETTRDQIVRVIDRGVREGQGIEAIAKELRQAVPALARVRSHVIARTETHTAAIYAGQEVAKSSPFPMNKRWVSVFDHRTRDFGEGDGVVDTANHRVMNNVTVGPDEVFEVPNKFGGKDMMAFPGDPAAPGYQTINCRCGLVYRRVGRDWPTD
jgi:hypothetical protein